jgi:hypothetical protein
MLRDELKKKIAEAKEQLEAAEYYNNYDAAQRARIELAVLQDTLQLLNEEQAEAYGDAPYYGDLISKYARDKQRF